MTSFNVALVKQLLRASLVADATVLGLASDRVYSAHPEDPDANTMTYPLVIVEMDGGRLFRASSVAVQPMSLWAYDRTSEGGAEALYKACCDVLQSERLADSTLAVAAVCREVDRPSSGWNEVVRAHYVLGRWNVQAASTA